MAENAYRPYERKEETKVLTIKDVNQSQQENNELSVKATKVLIKRLGPKQALQKLQESNKEKHIPHVVANMSDDDILDLLD